MSDLKKSAVSRIAYPAFFLQRVAGSRPEHEHYDKMKNVTNCEARSYLSIYHTTNKLRMIAYEYVYVPSHTYFGQKCNVNLHNYSDDCYHLDEVMFTPLSCF